MNSFAVKRLTGFVQWLLVGVSCIPILYSETITIPSLSYKTLFLRFVIWLVSVLATVLFCSSELFRTSIQSKILALQKNRIVQSVFFLWVILGISTLLAFDKYIAFFGEIERGEGFVGLTLLFAFFAYTSVFFEKKQWEWFLGLTICSGLINGICALVQYSGGMTRPVGLIGNPIYLGGYFLFVFFCCMYFVHKGIISHSRRLMYIGGIGALFTLFFIMLTKTRSVLIGLFLSIFITGIYFVFQGKHLVVFKKITAKRLAICILSGMILFSGIFWSTRQSSFWLHIPGADRVSSYTTSDATTHSRLIFWDISLHAINPSEVGFSRFLFGWGWDNYMYAWQTMYQPRLFIEDHGYPDRPHNKLLDMFTMTGVLGLCLYIILWVYFFITVLKIGKSEPFLGGLFLLWGTAFFIQNLFDFDVPVTMLTFFAAFGFVVLLSSSVYEK